MRTNELGNFLNIEGNPFSDSALTEFLKPLAELRLRTLGVRPLNQEQEAIVASINFDLHYPERSLRLQAGPFHTMHACTLQKQKG